MKMTNGEYLTEVAYSLAFTDDLPRTIQMFCNNDSIHIEIQDVPFEQDPECIILARAVLKNDGPIADLLVDGTIVSYDTDYIDWLNDEFVGITNRRI